MDTEFEKQCEEIDASVFSGDALYIKDNLIKFKEYLERWKRAVEEMENTI